MHRRAVLVLPTAAILLFLAPAPPGLAQGDPEGAYQPRPRGTVTWAGDIAEIVYKHCSNCHNASGGAPFPLMTHREARRRARVIGRAVSEGFMPPTLPAADSPAYINAPLMSAQEKGLLMQWAREGAPAGEGEAPAPPEYDGGWPLGPPDLVVEAKEGYTLPLDAFNLTRSFTFPLLLERDRWVGAVALKASSGNVLRALLFIDRSGATANASPTDLDVVVTQPTAVGPLPVGGLGGLIVEPEPWPFPFPFLLRRGSSVLLQVYFQNTGEEAEERPKLGFYYTAGAPRKSLLTVSLGTTKLKLPAGERTEVVSSFELPVPSTLLGVTPQAHLLAKELHGWATLPDGARRWLLRIDSWDFTWQKPYWLDEPIELPAGSVLEMRYLYDNTEENESNPNFPPAAVGFGQTLAGEMAGLHVSLVVEPSARRKLDRAYRKYAKGLGL